jgi:hypothetical protein
MDATSNELEHTKIVSFPTLKLYTKGENKVGILFSPFLEAFPCSSYKYLVKNIKP